MIGYLWVELEVTNIVPNDSTMTNVRATIDAKIGPIELRGIKVVRQDGQDPYLRPNEVRCADGKTRPYMHINESDSLSASFAIELLKAYDKMCRDLGREPTGIDPTASVI